MKKKNAKSKKRFLGLLPLLLLGFAYWVAWSANTAVGEQKFLFIPTNATYDQVADSLKKHFVKSSFTFDIIARLKKYPDLIKPGRYEIRDGMSNLRLVNLLRSGLQSPLQITFPSRKTVEEVLGRMYPKLEQDSAALTQGFRLEFEKRGIDSTHYSCQLVPNTYEFYWNASPARVVEVLLAEKEHFWTDRRKTQAQALNLNSCEVMTLASIVQRETAKKDEMPRVAGVYLNRLRKGMRLQADPTLVFAITDRKVKRVLNVDKQIDSPYNTYKYRGLPPGPIYVPSITAIDAVLEPEEHNFLYFCAKEDFSGYHNFATNYSEHLRNARKYQLELNKRRIYN